jgi:hypothetical protein
MSFLTENSSNDILNIKLTNYGRNKLAKGELNFKNFSVGDSMVDYTNENQIFEKSNLKPFDKDIFMKNPIRKNTFVSSSLYPISTIYTNEKKIENIAKTRGFFINNTPTCITDNVLSPICTPDLTESVLKTDLYKKTGILTIATSNTITVDNSNDFEVGDLLLIRFKFTNTNQNVFEDSQPVQSLFFKITNISSNIITLDRSIGFNSLPYNNNTFTYYLFAFSNNTVPSFNTFYNFGDESVYWDDASLSLENPTVLPKEVQIWNYNVIFKNSVLGLTNTSQKGLEYYKGNEYSSFKNYIEQQQSDFISIIHYTNGTISNYYGEALYDDDTYSLKLTIPNIMYHKKTTLGIEIIQNTEEKFLVFENGALRYYDMLEQSSNSIVGKVFPDMRIIVLEDPEIISATMIKNNRIYTLPQANINALKSTGTLSVFNNENQKLHITYYMYSDVQNTGTPCSYITTISAKDLLDNCNGTINNVLEINLEESLYDFLYQFDAPDYNGFHASEIRFIFQITENSDEPKPDLWRQTSAKYSNISKLTLSDLQNVVVFNKTDIDTSTPFDISTFIQIPNISTPDDNSLNFSEEKFFFGNLQTRIQSTVYQSNIICILGTNEFLSSSNKTWRNTLPIYISEIGIYDEVNQMVAIGRFGKPIVKKQGQQLLINVSIDF